MKTAGIVADNYKLEKFKKELTAKGLTDFTIVPFTKDTSTIKVKCEESQYNEIANICRLVEIHFKQSN